MSEDFLPPGGGELERLLRDAVADPALAERLRRDPLAAAKDHGVVLGPTERAMLASIDSAQLESILAAMATTGIQPPHELPDAHAPVRGIRPGRVAVAVAATATVIGVGSMFVFSAGSRPRRPATTAPKSLPDAGSPDAGADGGAERPQTQQDIKLPKPTPTKPTPK